ncbi:MAG: hypothetical protein J5912_02815 [Clostridia bacterium]|nr:hypothetical protein [Clostridia bacterium]
MNEKLLTKRGTVTRIALLALAAVLLLSVIGYVSAKYVQQVGVRGSIKVSATLAKNIEVYEHKAERDTDGSYKLDSDSVVSNNTYELMPGVDVPKDPTVKVTGYTGMPAYVYVEVNKGTNWPSTVTYAIADGWTELRTGLWYREIGGKPAETTGTSETTGTASYPDPLEFPIIKGDLLTVSQNLPRGTTASLSFRAYIVQTTEIKSALEVAQDCGLIPAETTANP